MPILWAGKFKSRRTAKSLKQIAMSPVVWNLASNRGILRLYTRLPRTRGNMDGLKTLEATYQSCVVELNAETRKQLGIAEGATVIRHANDGKIEVELLPSRSADLLTAIHEIYEEMK